MHVRVLVLLCVVTTLAGVRGARGATTHIPMTARVVRDGRPPANLTAPDEFRVMMKTTQGNVELDVYRAWAPIGVDHFFDAVKAEFYDDNVFFRVVNGRNGTGPRFVAQWGINGEPALNAEWENVELPNEAPGNVVKSNTRGRVSYAANMINGTACCRTTQIYVNYGDNSFLDAYGFVPFGEIGVAGMKVMDKLYNGYQEASDRQDGLAEHGAEWLLERYPKLDSIHTTRVVDVGDRRGIKWVILMIFVVFAAVVLTAGVTMFVLMQRRRRRVASDMHTMAEAGGVGDDQDDEALLTTTL